MTDKEKIRKEVERLQDLTMDENKNFYSEAAEGEYNALCNIEHFIDSLQEESVSDDLESTNGQIINVWDKISSAAKALKICPTSICNCISGLSKKAGGYIWKKE